MKQLFSLILVKPQPGLDCHIYPIQGMQAGGIELSQGAEHIRLSLKIP